MTGWWLLLLAPAACPYTVEGRPDVDACSAPVPVTAADAVVGDDDMCRPGGEAVLRVEAGAKVLEPDVGWHCAPWSRPGPATAAVPSPPAAAPAETPRTVFLPAVTAVDVTPEDAQTATRLLTAAASRRRELTVTSGDALRDLVAEAAAAAAQPGCADENWCINELAGALGAQYLLVGTLAQAGRLQRLSVQVLDAESAQVVGRASAWARDVFGFRPHLDGLVSNAFASVLGSPHVELPLPVASREVGDEDSLWGAAGVASGATLGAAACMGATAAVVFPFLAGVPNQEWNSGDLGTATFMFCGVPCAAAGGACAASWATEFAMGFSPSWWRALLVSSVAFFGAAVLTLGFASLAGLAYGLYIDPSFGRASRPPWLVAAALGSVGFGALMAAGLAGVAVPASLFVWPDEAPADAHRDPPGEAQNARPAAQRF